MHANEAKHQAYYKKLWHCINYIVVKRALCEWMKSHLNSYFSGMSIKFFTDFCPAMVFGVHVERLVSYLNT
jgi:hypothetical protein